MRKLIVHKESRMRELLMAAGLTVLLGTSAQAQSPALREDPVRIYLTTSSNAQGFTDPDKGRGDSLKDLAGALGKKKSIRMVTAREDAVIVIEVLNRGVREDSGTMTQMFGGKHEVKVLRVKLTVGAGDFSAELSGESAGGGMKGGPGRGAWTKAAYKVADQVDKWVQENEAQLRSAPVPLAAALPSQ